MADIQKLADKCLDLSASSLDSMKELIEMGELCGKDRIRAVEAINKITNTILDRVYAKKVSSRNENIEVNLTEVLAQLPPPVLKAYQSYLSIQEGPKHVESESRPISD